MRYLENGLRWRTAPSSQKLIRKTAFIKKEKVTHALVFATTWKTKSRWLTSTLHLLLSLKMKMKTINRRNQIKDMSFSTILCCSINSRNKQKRMSWTKKDIRNTHFSRNFTSLRPAYLNFPFKSKLFQQFMKM